MARPTASIARYVSIDILRLRQLFCDMSREEIGSWVEKALEDMSKGCVGRDVDPIVAECFAHATERLSLRREHNRKAYERKKNSTVSVSTEVANIGATKRNDQLIWGKFENVFLSQDEYNELATDFGNINLLNQVIESFSASLADGNTESKNHFATLSRWIAWRKAQQEKEENAPRRATFREIDAARDHEILRSAGIIK